MLDYSFIYLFIYALLINLLIYLLCYTFLLVCWMKHTVPLSVVSVLCHIS